MKETPSENKQNQSIPPLEIIDLDEIDTNEQKEIPFDQSVSDDFYAPNPKQSGKKNTEEPKNFFEKYVLGINWHIILLLVVVFSVIFVVYRFSNWGTRVGSQYDPEDTSDYDIEVYDNILPLYTTEEREDDGVRTVVVLGNSPFADDKGSDDNLASLIEGMTDATIYNCAVSGSFLAAAEPTFDASKDPMDAFNLYWLSTLIAMDNDIIYERAFQAMGPDTPEDAQQAYETLSSLDFNTVDVIAIMYDASDYLDGRLIMNAENRTDIQSFYGNMNASLELIQSTFPHIRLIVMSPTYAYAVNEEGEYVDSELYLYAEHPLSRYSMLLEQSASAVSASFLDNYYGTVNELNAADYLEDNLHLNLEGRKKLAERFVYALEYYD